MRVTNAVLTGRTYAHVAVEHVDTLAAIHTRQRLALENLLLTVETRVARHAATHAVETRAAIDAIKLRTRGIIYLRQFAVHTQLARPAGQTDQRLRLVVARVVTVAVVTWLARFRRRRHHQLGRRVGVGRREDDGRNFCCLL